MEKRNYQFNLIILTGNIPEPHIPVTVELTSDEVEAFIPHLLDVWHFYDLRDLGWCLADWPESVASICADICKRAEQLAEEWRKENNFTCCPPVLLDFPEEMLEIAAPLISWQIDTEEHDNARLKFWEKYVEREAALMREGKMKYPSDSIPTEFIRLRDKYQTE